MKMGVFFVSLVALVLLGIWTVGERARATRMAYELGEIRQRIGACERGNRTLREEAARLQAPARLVRAAGEHDLGLAEQPLEIAGGAGTEAGHARD